MKKIVFLALLSVVFGAWNRAQAQDCDELLAPYFHLNHIDPQDYPPEKAEWRCTFAKTAFYFTNSLPENAVVLNLNNVVNLLTGEKLSSDFVVDLEHLSYYGYNFSQLQNQNDKKTIYFRIQNNKHKYLALRSIIEMAAMTEALQRPK